MADASHPLTLGPAAAAQHLAPPRGATPDADGQRFDQARVDAVRGALREGRYRVDARRLADAFLRVERADVHPLSRDSGR